MNKQQEALKLALEALEYLRKPIAQGWEAETQQEKRDQAITVLREALAEQPAQQEPSMAYKVKMCPRQECASAAKCMSVACSSRAYIKPEQPAQQQEPVAFIRSDRHGDVALEWDKDEDLEGGLYFYEPLYTSPPASKPLTQDMVESCPLGS